MDILPPNARELFKPQLPDTTTERAMGHVARLQNETLPRHTRAELFYREIITSDGHEIPDGVEPIIANVHSADRLEIQGRRVNLRSHQLFAFNALLHLRGSEGGIARADIFELGFAHGTPGTTRSPAWTKALGSLAEKINTAAGTEIIIKTGRAKFTRYHVHPGFTLERSPEYQVAPEGFYEFAQLISGPLLRARYGETITPNEEEPIQILIRDNETIVVDNVATLLNAHDRSLLHILTLGDGQPLTFEQIFSLGFHAYAVGGQAKDQAIYRSVQKLNAALGGNDNLPFLHLNVTRRGTSLHTLRSFTLRDIRTDDPFAHSLHESRDRFRALLASAPENIIDTGPSRTELIELCLAHSNLLTMRESYTLSLRLGEFFPFLQGTSFTASNGRTISYDEIAQHIVKGAPLPRSFIGSLLGVSDGSIHSSESYAFNKFKGLRTPTTAMPNETEPSASTLSSDYLYKTDTYAAVPLPVAAVSPHPKARPKDTIEKVPSNDAPKKLALIAAKRLMWKSAQNGVPLTELLAWMEEGEVNKTIKVNVLQKLYKAFLITIVKSDNDLIIAMDQEVREMHWPLLEARLLRLF